MKLLGNNKGFTLIELIITAAIIGILAGAVITFYIGTIEKAKVASITRTASSASADLDLWLHSSLSDKSDLREIDTNHDGAINGLDKTNGELLEEGVATTYINSRNTVLREMSPWFDLPMWNLTVEAEVPPNGTINLQQPQSNQIRITAREKNGIIVYQQNLFI